MRDVSRQRCEQEQEQEQEQEREREREREQVGALSCALQLAGLTPDVICNLRRHFQLAQRQTAKQYLNGPCALVAGAGQVDAACTAAVRGSDLPKNPTGDRIGFFDESDPRY